MARLLLVVAAALILSGSAFAATIDDLRAAGYAVSLDGGSASCPTYYVTGHGVTLYINCNSQDVIDSLANPAAICNADWQANHSDQLDAWQSLNRKGWSISGNQCADSYTVTNPNDGTTAYSGPGSGLPAFNQSHDAPPASQTTTPGTPSPPANCLPLCASPPPIVVVDTPTGRQAVTVTATSAIAPITDPALAASIAAILFPDRSDGYLLRAGYGTDGALTP